MDDALHQGGMSDGKLEREPTALFLFLTSTAGVGEVPTNGRAFFRKLQEEPKIMPPFSYALFGLGNSKAHPHHFNAAAKELDELLLQQGGSPIVPTTLGDDSDCIEDDFDKWQQKVLEHLELTSEDPKHKAIGSSTTTVIQTSEVASKSLYPPLTLTKNTDESLGRVNLLNQNVDFYHKAAKEYKVVSNRNLNLDATANGLFELQLELSHNDRYKSGDHFVIYPRNPEYLVEAYLQLCGVENSGDVIQSYDASSYPHPTGISVHETLSHCVDLTATPSPSFVRYITNNSAHIDYKNDVAKPQRTVLDLCIEFRDKIHLHDLLYQLPPLKPRYYSIASSLLMNETTLDLTYRLVCYCTSRGVLRQGLTTSYMERLSPGSQVTGYISENASFRLPQDKDTPMILCAGGCGVAPVRAMVQERLSRGWKSPCLVFLGFRNPADIAYETLWETALKEGSISGLLISFQNGTWEGSGSAYSCGLVTDKLRSESKRIYEFMSSDGVVYVCGGARLFGAAIEGELLSILESEGGLRPEESMSYLQNMIKDGRLCEDLAG